MATSGNTLWLVVTDCWILLPGNIAAAIVVVVVFWLLNIAGW